jgi:hypothetical protein
MQGRQHSGDTATDATDATTAATAIAATDAVYGARILYWLP